MSHTIKQNRQHQPMWVYEKNFILLSELCPDLNISDEFVCITEDGDFEHRLHINVLERSAYTITLKLHQDLLLPREHSTSLVMQVRLYYDASLAEVLNYQGFSCLFENSTGRHRKGMPYHDKRQTNILLHDWLSIYVSPNLIQKPEYV